MNIRESWSSSLAFGLMTLLACLFVVHRVSEDSGQALAASDKAFDGGDLKKSVVEARFAVLESLRGSNTQHDSLERIEVIGVGSEAANRPKTALLAWISLLSASRSQSARLDASLTQHSEQQVSYLIEKITPAVSSGSRRADMAQLTLPNGSSASWAGPLLPVLAMLGATGVWLRRGANLRMRFGTMPMVVMVVAASLWCVGWLVA